MLHCYIIVPYRARGNQVERKYHLDYFIPYMNNYMKKFSMKYTIMVMEQNDDKLFNRGKLFNIGMLESTKLFVEGEKPYFCHQNVDLIPQKLDYSLYSEGITDVWGYDLGLGAMYFTDLASYIAINGYPNDYDGYGQDDVILLERCKFKNVQVNLSLKNLIKEKQKEVHDKMPTEFYMNDPRLDELLIRDYGEYKKNEWADYNADAINNLKVKSELSNPEKYIENGLNTCTYHVDSINNVSTHKHYLVSWD